MAFYRKKRRFGGGYSAPSAVMESTGTQTKRRSKCAGCGLKIEVGESFTRLRLRKRFRFPCSGCARVPKGAKRFHPGCVPTDREKAMGYDPNAQQRPLLHRCTCGHEFDTQHGAVRYCPACGHDTQAPVNRGGAIPPPPKPKSADEITLEAMVMLEAALVAQLKQRQKPMTDELKSEFKKFQGIKARVLRPSTPGEEAAATLVGLQRLVKLVLS